jgi:hypothetical protein
MSRFNRMRRQKNKRIVNAGWEIGSWYGSQWVDTNFIPKFTTRQYQIALQWKDLMEQGGQYKTPDDNKKPIGKRRILFYKDSNTVVSSYVPIYYANEQYYIQSTKAMAQVYRQFKYSLSWAKYSCIGIAFSDDFGQLAVFGDGLLESGIDFNNYTSQMHRQYLALKRMIFGIVDEVTYEQVNAALNMSKRVYSIWMKQKKLVTQKENKEWEEILENRMKHRAP